MPFNENKKIALRHDWARFTGFTYLFESNGTLMACDGFKKLDVSKGQEELYDGLFGALSGDRGNWIASEFLFCELPRESAHVTVKDGINDENVRLLREPHAEGFCEFLRGLPASLGSPGVNLPDPQFSLGEGFEGWTVTFKFFELELWGDSVLVAKLRPADQNSARVLERIQKVRLRLDEEWYGAYGLPIPERRDFTPHISLGYLPNRTLAAGLKAIVPSFSEEVAVAVDTLRLSFSSARLYAFENMATFIRK